MRRLPPVAGHQGVVLAVHRVLQVARLVADDQPPLPQSGAGHPGPPEHGVRAHEGDVRARVPGRRDMRPLLRGPVLVVARGEQRMRPVQQVRIGVDVHAGDVGQRPPGPLGQLDRLPLVVQEHVGAVGVVRPVQADRERPVAVVAHPAGPVVQVVAAPGVVGLPGLHTVLDHDLAGGTGRAHGHRHEPLGAVLRVQAEQVGTFRPVVGGHGQGRFPPGFHRVGRPDQLGLALPVPVHRARLPQQPRLVAVVPAHPEGTHPEGAGGGGHEQRDRLAWQHAGLPRIADDGIRSTQVPDVPVRVARTVVLAQGAFRGGPRSLLLTPAPAAAPAVLAAASQAAAATAVAAAAIPKKARRETCA